MIMVIKLLKFNYSDYISKSFIKSFTLRCDRFNFVFVDSRSHTNCYNLYESWVTVKNFGLRNIYIFYYHKKNFILKDHKSNLIFVSINLIYGSLMVIAYSVRHCNQYFSRLLTHAIFLGKIFFHDLP